MGASTRENPSLTHLIGCHGPVSQPESEDVLNAVAGVHWLWHGSEGGAADAMAGETLSLELGDGLCWERLLLLLLLQAQLFKGALNPAEVAGHFKGDF